MWKKIRWILLGFTSVIIILLTYAITLVRYAETEITALAAYQASIENFSEVKSVLNIHRFNGLESYIVAKIEHESGEEIYYFIFDDAVKHYFFARQLLEEQEAENIALNLIDEGEIIKVQLGILNETPIFEIQIEQEEKVYYIVINAKNGALIMDFYV